MVALTDEQAALVDRHRLLAMWAVKRFRGKHRGVWNWMEYEEMLSAAYLGLCRAVQAYDPGRGAAFTTYAAAVMEAALFRAAQKWQAEQEREARRRAGFEVGQAVSAEREVVACLQYREFRASLPTRLADTLDALQGTEYGAELARALGLTRQGVHCRRQQLESRWERWNAEE